MHVLVIEHFNEKKPNTREIIDVAQRGKAALSLSDIQDSYPAHEIVDVIFGTSDMVVVTIMRK